jgi:hypothetical protein
MLHNINKIKTIHDKLKLREFMTIQPALPKILEGILHRGKKVKHSYKNMGKNKFHLKSR